MLWSLCLVSTCLVQGGNPAVPAASRIKLVQDGITLQQALAEIARQSGTRLLNSLPKDDNPTLKLNLKDVPFWQALDEVAKAANAEVQLYREDGQIELVRRGSPPRMPISYSGLFRVALKKLSVVHDFANQTRGLTLVLETVWEPSFEPFYLETRPHKVVLADDAGKRVTVPASGSLWTPVDGKRALSFEVSLPALPRSAAKIGVFKGVLPVRGPGAWHLFRWKDRDGKEITLADLSKSALPLTVQAGTRGTRAAVNKVKLGTNWTVQVAVELPGGGPEFESFQTWYANNEVYLVSPDGKRVLKPTAHDQESAGIKRAVVNYHFRGPGRGKPEDWVLVCRAPASIVEMEIPFEFKDVELP